MQQRTRHCFADRLGNADGSFVAANAILGVLIAFFQARCESRLAHDLMNDCVGAPYIWFIQRNSVSLMRMFQQEVNAWGRDFLANALNLFNHVLTVVIGVAIVFGLAAMAAFIVLPVSRDQTVTVRIAAAEPDRSGAVELHLAPEREQGRGYYCGVCFHIYVSDSTGVLFLKLLSLLAPGPAPWMQINGSPSPTSW